MNKGSNFCTMGGFQATVYRAKFRNSYVVLITDYDIYASYKPILLYLLVLFMVCVITHLKDSFLVWGYYSWNACEMWMKFSIVLILFLDYVSYIIHLSPSLLHDLVLFLAWWDFTLLLTNCKTKTLKNLFYLVLFYEIVLDCSLVV